MKKLMSIIACAVLALVPGLALGELIANVGPVAGVEVPATGTTVELSMLGCFLVSVLWPTFKGWMGKLTSSTAAGAIPGATIGAVAGWCMGMVGEGALIGIIAAAFLCLISSTSRWWLQFSSTFQILAVPVSAILGVPLAVIGIVCGAWLSVVGIGFTHEGVLADICLDGSIGYCVGAAICIYREIFWGVQGWKLQTVGYIAPYPTKFEQAIADWLYKTVLAIGLGPVKVYGTKRAQSFTGRRLYGGNHVTGHDFIIARIAAPFRFRQVTQMRQIVGIRAVLGAFSAAFGVPSEGGKSKGNAEAVINGSAEMLAKHPQSAELIYPPGTLQEGEVEKGELVSEHELSHDDIRTGWFRIMQLTVDKTGDENICFQPKALVYISKLDHKPFIVKRWIARLWVDLGYSKTKKYGAVAVLGHPITYGELKDPKTLVTTRVLDPKTNKPAVDADGQFTWETVPVVDLATGRIDARRASNYLCDRLKVYIKEAKMHLAQNSDTMLAAFDKAGLDEEQAVAVAVKLFDDGMFTVEKLRAATPGQLTEGGLTNSEASAVIKAVSA